MDKPNDSQVPQSRLERDELCAGLRAFVSRRRYTPPLMLDELRAGVAEFVAERGVGGHYADWLAVMLNNEVWREEFSKTPQPMRVLLLPQCLRASQRCPAGFDEIGLLCENCGSCEISALQEFADMLGSVSLVTDSTGAVERLIEEGRVSAVVGVSCMESLERSFPRTLKRGVAGLAFPLLNGGCKDTVADFDLVREAFALSGEGFSMPSDAEIKAAAEALFSEAAMLGTFGAGGGECARISAEYVAAGGKRWRPRLALSAWAAMSKSSEFTDDARRIAVASECFHKASLIHDDIEDGDEFRDGVPALHSKAGISQAVNAGDFLVGCGYAVLGGCAEAAALVASAAKSHKILCEGQGLELAAAHSGARPGVGECLEIYRRKTGAAFGASLEFAAIVSGRFGEFGGALWDFSEKLGIAYQLFDEWRDSGSPGCASVLGVMREGKSEGEVLDRFASLYEESRQAAYRALAGIGDAALKRLLFSMAGRMLGDVR